MARHETGWFARASREQARGRIAISLGNVRLAAGVNPQAPGNEEKTRAIQIDSATRAACIGPLIPLHRYENGCTFGSFHAARAKQPHASVGLIGAAVTDHRCVASLLALAGHPHLLPKTGAFT